MSVTLMICQFCLSADDVGQKQH